MKFNTGNKIFVLLLFIFISLAIPCLSNVDGSNIAVCEVYADIYNLLSKGWKVILFLLILPVILGYVLFGKDFLKNDVNSKKNERTN